MDASRRRATPRQTFALPLIDAARERGFAVKTAIMDKGYDNEPIHDGCMDRGVCAVHPASQDARASSAASTSRRPCEHGDWTFAGADFKRKATKWRCPTGECQDDRFRPLALLSCRGTS